ncbi:hypothetical protein PTTG_02185, partial [Puccinia triticina 1-1 BBBD Race 1]
PWCSSRGWRKQPPTGSQTPGGGSSFEVQPSPASYIFQPSPRKSSIPTTPPRIIATQFIMPMPWETFIPLGLLTVMFGASGTLLNAARRFQNDGKPPDYCLDKWDEMMQERNQRLTGSLRGQCAEEKAPLTFQTSSAWPVEKVA